MIRKVIPKAQQNKLFLSIEANMSSFRKRGIAYVINAHADDLATVIVMVTGKRGTVQKDLILKYDTLIGWQVYVSGEKFTLVGLSELSTIVKSIVAKLSTTLTKI